MVVDAIHADQVREHGGLPGVRDESVLESALGRHPYDRDLLFTLAAYDREAGREERADGNERLLRALEPEAFEGN